MILRWRNAPEVAAFMFRDDPITAVEHERWFAGALIDREEVVHRVFTHAGTPSGLFSLSGIDRRNHGCVWGGYLAPDAPRGSGLGVELMTVSLVMSFDELDLHRVVVEAIESNTRAIGLYEKIGFRREGFLRDRARQSHGFVNVVLLGLLRDEWRRA